MGQCQRRLRCFAGWNGSALTKAPTLVTVGFEIIPLSASPRTTDFGDKAHSFSVKGGCF